MTKVSLVHRNIMQVAPHDFYAIEGESLAEMAKRVKTLPEGWPRHEHDVICVNGSAVPREAWPFVKPHAVSRSTGVRTEVTFHAPPMGGGDGGKNILGVVASIGLLALSGGVASSVFGALGGTGSLAGATGTAASLARLAGAAVLLTGNAILQALAPTPSAPRRGEADDPEQLGSSSASGNILEPNAPLPRVVGTRKIFPPFVTEPLVYYDGSEEVVEVLCALAGPHKLEDIRVGDAPIDDISSLSYETREGWAGLDALALLTRYGRTVNDGAPLRGHLVSEDQKDRVESLTGNILDALPPKKVIATRTGPDEFWIGLQFSQGLSITTSQGTQLRVPLRIRIREKGESTWVNLPEIHFKDSLLGTRRVTVKFAWREASVDVGAVSGVGWVEARNVSPGQSISPATDDWVADSYFDADTGGADYLTSGNAGSSDVINVIAGENEVEFQLDQAVFPKAIYEIELQRGFAFRNSQYSPASYTLSGTVKDPFSYESGDQSIHQTRSNMVDEITVVRYSSVWSDAPVKQGDTAMIAIRARDTKLDRISTVASGYVRDWDGSAWTDWKTTNNPAPHLRDVFFGLMNATPFNEQLEDTDTFLAFRSDGWTCDAICEGLSVGEAGKIIAGSGYAQYYQSDIIGVIRDRDRTADSPVQIFTPHNTSSFSWSRGMPKLPNGFRATFVDANDDYEARQIIHPPGADRTEQVTIEGIVEEDKVRARLQYDLDSARYRAAFYSFDASADAIKCRRGSLIGLVSDALSKRSFSGKVADVEYDSSGDVIAVRLDNEATLESYGSWASISNLAAVPNVALINAKYGLAVRRKGQVATTVRVTTSALGDKWVDLVTPTDLSGMDYGDLAAIGPLGKEFRRLIVIDMQPRTLTEWTVTAVPEAPELWQ